MAGLLFPTSGLIKADEKPVTRDMVRQTAYLTELDMFYPHFTVKDMVNFYQSQFPDFQTEQAYKLLNEMRLDPKKDQKAIKRKSGKAENRSCFSKTDICHLAG